MNVIKEISDVLSVINEIQNQFQNRENCERKVVQYIT